MDSSKAMQAPYVPTTSQPIAVATSVQTIQFGENSLSMFCPYCQESIITFAKHNPGTLTWLASGIICCAGGFGGCCLIPFLLDSCKDVTHSCPKCDKQLGLYKRL